MLFFSGFHLLSAITRKFQGVPGCAFFLLVVFFCLCPRLLTWHSSLKFHFEKEEGQERWKFSSLSSWLGGGGGGKECGDSCCGPRAWSGQGFQMWRALAPVGSAAEPVGDRRNILARGKETMGENSGQQKPHAHKSWHFLAVITTGWSRTLIQHGTVGEGAFLNKVKSHFIKNWVCVCSISGNTVGV